MEKAHWLDDLKLRFGWGQLGNSNVALYSSFTKLSPGITVDYQGNSVNTIQIQISLWVIRICVGNVRNRSMQGLI